MAGSGVAQMKFVLAGEVVPAARRFFAFSAGAVKVGVESWSMLTLG